MESQERQEFGVPAAVQPSRAAHSRKLPGQFPDSGISTQTTSSHFHNESVHLPIYPA